MSRSRARRGGRGKPPPSRYRPYIIGAAAAVAVVLAVVGIAALARGGGSVSGPVVVPTPRPGNVPQQGHVHGDPAAPVTITEYLDFQCPFCRAVGINVMPQIDQRFIETGQAKLDVHPIAILGDESVQAAAAAECATGQSKFWAFHDILYANQGQERSGAFSDDRLKQFAQALGLDTSAFNSCLDSGHYRDTVTQNTSNAAAGGVKSTPTILVNGVVVDGTVDAIAAAIQQAASP